MTWIYQTFSENPLSLELSCFQYLLPTHFLFNYDTQRWNRFCLRQFYVAHFMLIIEHSLYLPSNVRMRRINVYNVSSFFHLLVAACDSNSVSA